jgi:concanavalin A-like lectin/glucanase superfamily protein
MLSRNINGFTEAQVNHALKGLSLPLETRVRAELLDLDNAKLIDLDGLQLEGSISHNTDQPLKRNANLVFKEKPRDSQHSNPLGTFASLITAQNRLFHLRLGETSGNFADFTGNGRTFTANGGITYSVASLVAGDQSDNAITLNGTTGYLSIAVAAWMNSATFTLSLVWKGTTNGATQELIGQGSTYDMTIDSNGLLSFVLAFTSGSPATYATGINIADSTAHLLQFVYDQVNFQIFIDGRRVLKTAETRTPASATTAINIGRNVTGVWYSVGTFDEVGMVGRALTPKEIRDEYQAWSNQTNELILDRDRGDRVKIWHGIRMPSAGTDGTTWAEWPLIIAVLTTPRRNYSQTGISISITCQDQTRILADDKFTVRITLAAGANYITGTNGVISIAQSSGFNTSAWAVTGTALTTPADVDFEIASSKLDAINYLLTAINYRPIRFAGDGSAIIEPNVLDKDRTTVDTLASGTGSVISAEDLTVEIEPRRVINRVTVFNGNPDATPITSTAVNDKPRSPTSTVFISSQTRELQVDVPDQTTADNLADQVLSDETIRWARRIKMNTLPRPIHDDRDRLRLTLSELGVDADYVEEEWVLPLSPTELMSHTFLSVIDVTT